MDYIVSGPHVIPTKLTVKGAKVLDCSKDTLKKFWEDEQERVGLPIGAACGCYIYAIKAGPGFTPWYVGQAKGRFDDEVFHLDKYKKYMEHYAGIKKGSPVIFLVIRQTPKGRIKGVKLNKSEADWVEDYLTRRALDKNPNLLNKQKTRHFTNVRIPGIHNAKAKTPADKELAKALTIRRPYGFTKPVGKFNKKRSQST